MARRLRPELQNEENSVDGLGSAPRSAAWLLLTTAGISLLAASAGQILLRSNRRVLTPAVPATELWTVYRWSPDPDQRRRAALLMANSGHEIKGQGWGDDSLAAVSLLLEAEAAEAKGARTRADALWRLLLHRFPQEPSSARARQRFPERHQELLALQPGHPAALATAVAMEPVDSASHQGGLHLARWGWRWTGAPERIRQACEMDSPSLAERQQLAWALGMLGRGHEAELCLRGAVASAETALAVGRALLMGDADQRRAGEALLLRIAQEQPEHSASEEAVRLLMAPLTPDSAIVEAIPSALAERSAAVAAAKARLNGGRGTLNVLEKWPGDRDSWQLQWDEARHALINERWEQARELLEALPLNSLPAPLEARRLFWLGFSESELGQTAEAQRHWQTLLAHHPPGYYRWRAATRMQGAESLDLRGGGQTNLESDWSPLHSGFNDVDALWRLGLNDLVWDAWLQRRPRGRQLKPEEQLVEGRLRLGVDDPWNGLDQLWRLNVRWAAPSCNQRRELHRSQNLMAYLPIIQEASKRERIRPELLLAIAKQESRFSATIRSSAGAVGLMQLMPSTATSLSEQPLSQADLMTAAVNIPLGAAYLVELLEFWDGDPYLSIASYNAGPTTVANWPQPREDEAIELWVERIPYPETRYYTKKVLDNLLSYSDPSPWKCDHDVTGMGEGMTENDTTEQQASQQEN